jgi:hypothetical protein
VTITAADANDATEISFELVVLNVAPTPSISGASTGQEGTPVSLTGSATDPAGSNDTISLEWSVTKDGNAFASGTGADIDFTPDDDGTYVATLTASDEDGGSDSTIHSVEVANVAPTIVLSGGPSVEEGSTYVLTLGAVTDPGDDTVSKFIVHWGDGDTDSYASAGDVTHTYDDGDDTPTITVDLVDEDGTHVGAGSLAIAVDNVAPTISAIVVPIDPVDINEQPVSASATFGDPGGIHDVPYTCAVDYGDGNGPLDGTVTGFACAGPDHEYDEPGVYVVTVTVTDKDGGTDSAEATEFIVIFDPDGGFVTGGGWINSPAEACPDFCGGATGKANFGFVSKYDKGASVPTGNTEFNFKAGGLNFHSDEYDWLVVAGQDKAKYKGVGTINGGGTYGFMLTATDGSPDTFRIKIWDKATEAVVYDNQMGASDDAYDGTVIGGGNIKVHKAK